MPSWGIELELAGISFELHIHRINLVFGLLGHDNRHYQLDIEVPIRIGPSYLEESAGLKFLARSVAQFLNEQNIPRDMRHHGNVNFYTSSYRFF